MCLFPAVTQLTLFLTSNQIDNFKTGLSLSCRVKIYQNLMYNIRF